MVESEEMMEEMRRVMVVIGLLCLLGWTTAWAQLTCGVTGLLHAPSAEMQKDGTIMVGGNFMNKELTPPTWYYHTANYYVNATLLPWFEFAYVATVFKMLQPTTGRLRYCNQDRHFAFRFRLTAEKEKMPALVAGIQDPYVFSSGEMVAEKGNGYFSRFYLAATKHFRCKETGILGVHVSYLYNRREDYPLNGVAGGVTFSPLFFPSLEFIGEYDTKDFALGAQCLLFNRLNVLVEMQGMRYFSGGLTYKIYLK